MSLLEVVIAATILATLVGAVFDLFRMQGREVSSSERGLMLHARAAERRAEEESRLNVVHFAGAASAAAPAADGSPFVEAVSVAPLPECTGLYKVTVSLTYSEDTGQSRVVEVSKLVVDRDRLTRLPACVRVEPVP